MKILAAALVDATKNDASLIHFRELARALVRRGHRVDTLLPGQGAPRPVDMAAPLRRAYDDSLPAAFLHGLRQAWRIASLAPDYDAVYIRWRLLPALLPRLLAELRHCACPPVITEHNGWVGAEVRVQRGSRLLGLLGTGLQYIDAASASGLVAVTPQIARRLAPASGPLAVVDNGTDITHFHPLPNRDALKKELLGGFGPVVGFCGNLSRWQGLSLVANAFSRLVGQLPEARLLVVGSGMAADEVSEEVRRLGIADRVHFAGDVDYADMNRWLNVMDVSLCPKSVRLAEYGYSPLKVRDSAAAGRPVVASRVPGLAELEGDWLRCFTPEDPDDLARVLRELLADPQRLERMGRAAREHAERTFSWDRAARKVETLLAGVVGDKRCHAGPLRDSSNSSPASSSTSSPESRTEHGPASAPKSSPESAPESSAESSPESSPAPSAATTMGTVSASSPTTNPGHGPEHGPASLPKSSPESAPESLAAPSADSFPASSRRRNTTSSRTDGDDA